MQIALHVTSRKGFKYFKKGKFQRIYWGAEFCQNLIPSLQETREAVKFADQHDLGFSLMTPFVTERGLQVLRRIFSLLQNQKIWEPEIIVNDWGILRCLDREFKGRFRIVLGRLLVRQHRDPMIMRILKKQLPLVFGDQDGTLSSYVHACPDEKYGRGVRSSYVNSSLLQDFLSRFGVERVELNNLFQGIDLEGIRFKKSDGSSRLKHLLVRKHYP